jgi:hypothetical protein
MKTGASLPNAADKLLDLLQRQRAALLRQDSGALADLEAGTAQLEKALADLLGQGAASLAGLRPEQIAILREQLQNNQATLAYLAAGNRRALNALFGEPPLYSM